MPEKTRGQEITELCDQIREMLAFAKSRRKVDEKILADVEEIPQLKFRVQAVEMAVNTNSKQMEDLHTKVDDIRAVLAERRGLEEGQALAKRVDELKVRLEVVEQTASRGSGFIRGLGFVTILVSVISLIVALSTAFSN